MSKKYLKEKNGFYEVNRISIYLYEAQLNKINEICQKRNKTKRRVFFEAIQMYIALYDEGKV